MAGEIGEVFGEVMRSEPLRASIASATRRCSAARSAVVSEAATASRVSAWQNR